MLLLLMLLLMLLLLMLLMLLLLLARMLPPLLMLLPPLLMLLPVLPMLLPPLPVLLSSVSPAGSSEDRPLQGESGSILPHGSSSAAPTNTLLEFPVLELPIMLLFPSSNAHAGRMDRQTGWLA
jgi:hypothetical protein